MCLCTLAKVPAVTLFPVEGAEEWCHSLLTQSQQLGAADPPPLPPTLDALCISPSQSQLLRKPKNNLLYISMLLRIVPSILFQNCLNQKKLPISVLKGQQCTFLFWLKSQIGTLSHLFIISWYMVNHHWAVLWWILSQRLWIAGNIAFLLPICIHWAEYS